MPDNISSDASSKSRGAKAPSAFRTISEVANELHVPQHVLRFWEGKFAQIRPLKRGGGRRYYRPDDIALLRQISTLLYVQGYTIKGVQRLLREGGGQLSDDIPPPAPEEKIGAQPADLFDDEEPQLPMPGLTPRIPPTALARPNTPPKSPPARSNEKPRRPSKADLDSRLAESMGLELVRLQRVLHETLSELEAIRDALR